MEIDYEKFWDERIKEAQESVEPLRENEMTVKMFQDKAKKPYRASREFLERLVEKGILGKRFAIVDGHNTAIYFPCV